MQSPGAYALVNAMKNNPESTLVEIELTVRSRNVTENICAFLTKQKVKIAGYCFSIIYRLRQSRGRQKYEKKKKKRKDHRSYNVRNFSRKR